MKQNEGRQWQKLGHATEQRLAQRACARTHLCHISQVVLQIKKLGCSKEKCSLGFHWTSDERRRDCCSSQLLLAWCVCAHVCVCARVLRFDWPVISGLNWARCLRALLIKLQWPGLVGTCHEQPKTHPSPTDLATAWPLQKAPRLRRLPGPGTDHSHYPWTWSQDNPLKPLLHRNLQPCCDPSKWPQILKPRWM